MNPKRLHVRVDRESGELWLTEERLGKPLRRVKNITADVLLAMSSELTSVDNSPQLTREIKFADGMAIRVTIDLLEGPKTDAPTPA